ncbi:MAG: chitinase [Cellulomonas sp.]
MTMPTAAPRRMRVSFLRVAVVLVCATAVGWGGFRTVSAAVTPTPTPGPSTFSAYVDVTAWPTYPFETPAGPAQSDVILSFIVADAKNRCTPTWGAYYTLDGAASNLELDRRVSQLRLTGGDVRVSFGGQANSELATVCTDAADLRSAYQSVVDRYDLRSIDLDIEGGAVTDTASLERRAVAIKAVQDAAVANGRGLDVWLTLPVAPTGLTDAGVAVVTGMLAAGVDVAGVNGMTMDFGVVTTAASPLSAVVVEASTALHRQIVTIYGRAGQHLGESEAWGKVGITPMIGQADVQTERFTLTDAVVLNQFARDNGVGLVSMWSLNRDSTCRSPLPKVLTVMQTSCSGVDQGGASFAETLASDLPYVVDTQVTTTPEPSASTGKVEPPTVAGDLVDDPAHSPYPIWDTLGTYPAGTRIVWHKQVYQARYWTSGYAPDTAVTNAQDTPWTLLGPVLPGDTPAPLPTLPAGSYPQWDPAQAYTTGSRVQIDLVPYEAKWWTQGQKPGISVAGGSPWVLVLPAG